MKLENKSFVKFMQEGGMAPEAPAPEAAPAQEQAPEQGGDPLMQIVQAAALAVLTLDALLALLVCLALIELAGAGSEPAPTAPEGQLPVYKKGGKLSKWVSK